MNSHEELPMNFHILNVPYHQLFSSVLNDHQLSSTIITHFHPKKMLASTLPSHGWFISCIHTHYPLVMANIAIENHHFYGKIHYFYGHFPVRYVCLPYWLPENVGFSPQPLAQPFTPKRQNKLKDALPTTV